MRGQAGHGLLLAVWAAVCSAGCEKAPEPPTEPSPRELTVCTEQQRNCGTAINANGETVECGTCGATQTCGGGGHAGLCGGSHCALECPTGFRCLDGATCTGGPRQGIALDLKAFEVQGRMLRDGALIADTSCTHHEFTHSGGNTYYRSYLELTELTSGTRYYIHVSCSQELGWTFRGWVPPGAYTVVFHPEPHYSSQKELEGLTLSTCLSVQADREDVVFDARPPPVTQGGRGAQPRKLAAAQSTAVTISGPLVFEDEGSPPACTLHPSYSNVQLASVVNRAERYGLSVDCSTAQDGTAQWTFQGSIPAGTYAGSFWHYDFDTAESTTFPLASDLVVDGPRSGLAIRVALPPVYPEVSGTLTLQGQAIGAAYPCGHITRPGGMFSNPRFFHPHVVLIDEQEGDSYRLPITCGNTETGDDTWTFSGRAPAGTYRVELQLDQLYRPEALVTSTLLDRVPGPVIVFNPRLQLP